MEGGSNGGQESQCGWCKDKWGISWQITPRALTEALAAGGDEARRAFEAMMNMKKIDVAAIRKARAGVMGIPESAECVGKKQPVEIRVRPTNVRAKEGRLVAVR